MSRIRIHVGILAVLTLALTACSSTSTGSSSTATSTSSPSSSPSVPVSSNAAPAASTSSASVAATSGDSGTCTPKHAGLTTIVPGTLTVSAYVSPPYTVENGAAIDGVDGIVVKKIAAMECLALDAKSVAGAALPASITSKRADIAIGGVYFSADRASTFSLSSPMYRDGMSLLSKDGVSTISALSGKTIGVIQGYLWNAELQQVFGTGSVKIYQTSAAMISDIKNGRVNVGVFTSAEAGYRAQQDPSLKAALLESTPKIAESQKKSNVVLLLEKGATALTAAMNDDIKAILADGTVAAALKTNGVDPSLVANGS